MKKVKEGTATILEFKTSQEQRFSRHLPPG
jgi:hypothetical protein